MKKSVKISSNSITVPSSTKYLSDIRGFVQKFGEKNGVNKKIISKISLAVDEACTNIIKHAYKNLDDKELNLKIKIAREEIRIKIIDNGIHFEPSQIHDPDIAESQKRKKGGGLGIYLMKKLMDKVTYSAHNGFNELVMIKKL